MVTEERKIEIIETLAKCESIGLSGETNEIGEEKRKINARHYLGSLFDLMSEIREDGDFSFFVYQIRI